VGLMKSFATSDAAKAAIAHGTSRTRGDHGLCVGCMNSIIESEIRFFLEALE